MKSILTLILLVSFNLLTAQSYNYSLRTTAFDDPNFEPYAFSLFNGNESTVSISCGNYAGYTAQIWYQRWEGQSYLVINDPIGSIIASKKLDISSVVSNTFGCLSPPNFCRRFNINSIKEEDCSTLIFTGSVVVVKNVGGYTVAREKTIFGKISLSPISSPTIIIAEMLDFPTLYSHHRGEELIFANGNKYLVSNQEITGSNIGFFINELFSASTSNIYYGANLSIKDVTHSSNSNEIVVAGFSSNNPSTTSNCNPSFNTTIDVLRIDLTTNTIAQRASYIHSNLKPNHLEIEYDPLNDRYVLLSHQEFNQSHSEIVLFRLDPNLNLIDSKVIADPDNGKILDFNLLIKPTISPDYHISFIYNTDVRLIRYLKLDKHLKKKMDKSINHPDGYIYMQSISSDLRNATVGDGEEIIYSIGNAVFKQGNFDPNPPIGNGNDPWEMVFAIATSTVSLSAENCEEDANTVLDDICIEKLSSTDPTNNVVTRSNTDRTIDNIISEVGGLAYDCSGYETEYSSAVLRKSNINLSQIKDEEEIFTASGISVFPNPFERSLTIELVNIETPTNFEIIDTKGKIVKTGTLDLILNKMDLSSLPKGLFILRICDSNEMIRSYKIVKTK